jgi:hypothetical protein
VIDIEALKHLRRPRTQRRQTETRQLLAAGLRLATEALSRQGSAVDGPVDFRWPSRKQIIDQFNRDTGLRMSKAVLEDRWATMADYYADLFIWSLHQTQWSDHQRVAVAAAPALVNAESFSAVARQVATDDLAVLLAGPSFRMKLLVCATFSATSPFHPVIADFYQAANDWWSIVYQRILDSAGLRLRPGIELASFAMLMTGLEEGLALRLLAHPPSFPQGLHEAAELLAVGALAMLHGAAVEPDKAATLFDAIDARMSPSGNKTS